MAVGRGVVVEGEGRSGGGFEGWHSLFPLFVVRRAGGFGWQWGEELWWKEREEAREDLKGGISCFPSSSCKEGEDLVGSQYFSFSVTLDSS